MVNIKNIMEAMSEIPNGIGKPPAVLPTRQLKPGQTATIDPKKYSRDEKGRVYDLLAMAPSVESEVDYLKYQIKNSSDPKIKAELQAKIDRLYDSLGNRKKEFSSIIEKIVPIIKSKCSEFLPTIQKTGFLYRGITVKENKNRLAFRAHSRDYRAPTHSNAAANKLFNDAMEELGLTATRTNSVFATGDVRAAGSFGKVYIFFPCNGSHYTWSETARDLILTPSELYQNAGETEIDYDDLDQYRQRIVNNLEMLYEKAKEENQSDALVGYYMSAYMSLKDMDVDPSQAMYLKRIIRDGLSLDGVNSGLLDALDTLYQDITANEQKIQDVNFEIDLDKFKDFYKLKGDEELNRAILSEHEILFTGEYICVAFGYKDLLLEALGMKKEDLNEALKPGQILPLTKFISPSNKVSSEMQNLQSQLNKLNKDLAFYKKKLSSITKSMKSAEKHAAGVSTKLQSPKYKNIKPDDKLAKLIAYLQKNCGNYISEMRKANQFLYRGDKSNKVKDIYHGRSWENRRPKDSDPDEQVAFDNILKMLKIKARRENSIYTAGDLDFASNYGNIFLIFPLNSANYSWSTQESDLVLDPGMITDYYGKKDPKSLKDLSITWKQYHRQLEKILSNSKRNYKQEELLYTLEDDLPDSLNYLYDTDADELTDVLWSFTDELKAFLKYKATKPIAEKMVGILKKYETIPTIITPADLKRFQKEYDIRTSDLAKALRNQGEILINGEYIAVDASKYGSELAKALNIKYADLEDYF